MNADFDAADIAAIKEQGDLETFLRALVGKPPVAPTVPTAEPTEPSYHIARPGAWPCGTAATGPTPKPCTECAPKGTL